MTREDIAQLAEPIGFRPFTIATSGEFSAAFYRPDKHRQYRITGYQMKKKIIAFTIALLILSSAWAGTFRVHYSLRGSGHDITIQADSSSEARRTVMDMFPGAVVTGVRRIK
jgi:hypothetical protein